MQKINDPSQVEDVTIRSFFQQRFEQLEGDISDTEFILVDSGDSLESLESGTGCALFSCWCSEAVYGDEDYQPSFEFIEQHQQCHEMLFVTSDDFNVIIVVPIADDIDIALSMFCREYS